MSAIANVYLSSNAVSAFSADAGSNGAVVYSPVGFAQPGVAKWADKSGGIPILWPSLTVSVRLPTSGSRVCRVVTKLVLPTEDAVVPSTKAYECLFQAEMVFPDRSTQAERNTLRSLALSALANQIAASDLDPVLATGSPLPAAFSDFEIPY